MSKLKFMKPSVASYISNQIAICGKQQNEIAAEVGYDKPNVITMIKQGKTKLPLDKVGAFAKALNVDPVYLMRLVMAEYHPETWNAVEEVIGDSLVTSNEQKILALLRRETHESDPAVETHDQIEALHHLAEKLESVQPVRRVLHA